MFLTRPLTDPLFWPLSPIVSTQIVQRLSCCLMKRLTCTGHYAFWNFQLRFQLATNE
jgi:hypothetical protein